MVSLMNPTEHLKKTPIEKRREYFLTHLKGHYYYPDIKLDEYRTKKPNYRQIALMKTHKKFSNAILTN